jgi:hypothetical protein
MSDLNQTSKEYPYKRQWCVGSVELDRYITIKKNWDESIKLINEIRKCLTDKKINSSVATVAAAGSIGRMEASPGVSDADLIVVLSEGTDLETPEATEAYESVWEALKFLKIDRPKPNGVFGKPTNKKELLGSLGNTKETLEVFGKRLLLLLETQPMYGDDVYTNLINVIVERYADEYVRRDPKKEWTFLLNDLIRYFRSLSVNYQWDFENEAGKWPIRNIKLRHSRLVMYSGLLMLLGEASKERRDKLSWLKERLKMTPMERLAWVYEQNSDWNFHRIAGPYDVFLTQLNIPEVRNHLNVDPVEAQDVEAQDEQESYRQRYMIPEFAALKANSDGLIAELLRFVLARSGSWSERFFEYLIF